MTDRILFLGSKNLGLRCLSRVHQLNPRSLAGVITIDDRKDSRSSYNEILSFCTNNNIELYVASDRKHSEDLIVTIQPSLCLFVGWYWIVTENTLLRVPKGCLGIHFSLLPKFRGWSPLVWAMLQGESETGLSLFSLTKDIDAGALWEQIKVPIHFCDDVGSVLQRLEDASVDVLGRTLPGILSGSVTPWEQSTADVSYCARRLPEDGLINWNHSASRIYDFVRAQSVPYPGAYSFIKDSKVAIWKVRPTIATFFGSPGQVVKSKDEGICVICADQDALALELIQFELDPHASPPEQALRNHHQLSGIISGTLRFTMNRSAGNLTKAE